MINDTWSILQQQELNALSWNNLSIFMIHYILYDKDKKMFGISVNALRQFFCVQDFHNLQEKKK